MTGTGPLGASDRSRESTAGLSDTSDPTLAPANDKLVTTAARPTAEECVRDRRLEERLTRLAVALRPRPSITSQISSDASDLTPALATDKPATASSPTTDALVTTAPLGELADIRRTPRWLNSITIAACLVAVTAVWWLYRSEVANHVEMAAENQQLAELRQAQQQAEASAATYQGSLTQERDKAEKLASELATARRALETQTAALAKASDRTAENQQLAELRQARQQAEASATAYQESLAQERARSQGLEQQLAALRDATPGRGRNATTSTFGPTPARANDKPATTPPATSDKPATMVARPTAPDAPGNPEVARLMARASVLLSQGNVGAARIVLDRAAETGSAPALFALAETYDPFVLAAWGTFGTQGDAVKARELYAKAFAGGVQEAGDRLNALRQ